MCPVYFVVLVVLYWDREINYVVAIRDDVLPFRCLTGVMSFMGKLIPVNIIYQYSVDLLCVFFKKSTVCDRRVHMQFFEVLHVKI